MNKIVIIINGNAGVGKDTLCELAAKHFKVKNISAITPIKEIAMQNGWDGSKDAKSRKLLAELKRAFVEYNDLPLNYLCNEYHKFLKSKEEIMFVHIREGEEISKFKRRVHVACQAILITRKEKSDVLWGNQSDDNVNNYQYDHVFKNDDSLKAVEKQFVQLIRQIMELVPDKIM